MHSALEPAELAELRKIPSPAICNAIETFNLRKRNEGYMDSTIKCMFPDLGVLVGYACTAQTSAINPPSLEEEENKYRYLDSVLSVPSPRIAVTQDLDPYPGVGTFWGEINANVYKVLDCAGAITNGGVRDIDEVHSIKFHLFANSIMVSHAYMHVVAYARPIRIGGLTIEQGDLLHADKHGTVHIPREIAGEVAAAALEFSGREKKLVRYCQSVDFELDTYKQLYRDFRSRK